MRSLVSKIFLNILTIYIIASLVGGVSYGGDIITLLWAATVLALVNLLVRPILNLLLLPINVLTLGATRWLINLAVLFIVTVFVTGFSFTPIAFPGLTIFGFTLPAFVLTSLWAALMVSFLIELTSTFFKWLFDK